MFRQILYVTSAFVLVREDRDTIMLHCLKINYSIPFYNAGADDAQKIIAVLARI